MLNNNKKVIKDKSTDSILNNISSIKAYKDVQISTTNEFLNNRSEMKNSNNIVESNNAIQSDNDIQIADKKVLSSNDNIDSNNTIYIANSKDSNNNTQIDNEKQTNDKKTLSGNDNIDNFNKILSNNNISTSNNNVKNSKTIHLIQKKNLRTSNDNVQYNKNKKFNNNNSFINNNIKHNTNNVHKKYPYNANKPHIIKIKKLSSNAIIPMTGTNNSAGYDLVACLDKDIQIQPNEIVLVSTGIAIEIPSGYFGMVCSRSGLACKYGIHVLNSPGIIDSDYRGEIKCILHNCSNSIFTLSNGTKMAQLIIMKHEKISWLETNNLSDTNRGENGFGSTGIKI